MPGTSSYTPYHHNGGSGSSGSGGASAYGTGAYGNAAAYGGSGAYGTGGGYGGTAYGSGTYGGGAYIPQYSGAASSAQPSAPPPSGYSGADYLKGPQHWYG